MKTTTFLLKVGYSNCEWLFDEEKLLIKIELSDEEIERIKKAIAICKQENYLNISIRKTATLIDSGEFREIDERLIIYPDGDIYYRASTKSSDEDLYIESEVFSIIV
jgi:predicted type IV restriction endonuclease